MFNEPMSLVSLIYVSSATKLFATAELLELLTKSRENNSHLGVTGMLLYKEGNFMQALEGEEEVVRHLFDKIGRDPRHGGVLVLRQAPQAQRGFPDWSMAFHDLSSPEARAIAGYSEFMNRPLTAHEFSTNPTLCQKLFLVFKRNTTSGSAQ